MRLNQINFLLSYLYNCMYIFQYFILDTWEKNNENNKYKNIKIIVIIINILKLQII